MRFAILILAFVLPGFSFSADEAPQLFEMRKVAEEAAENTEELVFIDDESRKVLVEKSSIITVKDISGASVVTNPQLAIYLEFSKESHPKIEKATRESIGKALALVLRGKVTSTPIVNDPVSTGAMVTGNFSEEFARELVAEISQAILRNE